MTQKQAIFLIVMFIIGSSILIVMGMEAKKDIWLAIITGMVASAIIMLIYVRLLTALPGRDFFETMEFFLGKVGGKVIIFFLTWFCFDLCAIVLRNYGQFVVTVGLKETPMIVIISVMIAICALAIYYGIEVIGRWNEAFVFFVIGFLLISIILVSGNMDTNNLLPIFDEGFKPILKGAFGVTTFPFLETVAFLIVFPKFSKGVSVEKVYLKGLLIGGVVILLTSVTDVLVLGSTIAEGMFYPTYSTFSTIHIGDFIYRLEAIAAIVFVIAVFVKITILLYGACNGTARLLGIKDYRFLIIPICILVVNSTTISSDDMIFNQEWAMKVWRYYGSFFEIIIPLFAYIIVEIRIKSLNTKNQTINENGN